MSHLAHRKETNCLNCGTTVVGPYCHVCGQENLEPEESVWHLIIHFFNDVTHFDGKFFSTLKDILLKPGFLSKEYMKGRRASFLNPIRMYLFTSFIFFLVFFSMYHFPARRVPAPVLRIEGYTEQQIDSLPEVKFEDLTKKINNGRPLNRFQFKKYIDSVRQNVGIIHFLDPEKNSNSDHKQNDSIKGSPQIKENRISHLFSNQEKALNNKYKGKSAEFISDFLNSLMHHFPQMLFVSLPLLALLLKLLYLRQKRFYYVSHAIFMVHYYIFVFIVLLLEIGINQLSDVTAWNWLNAIRNLLVAVIFFYLYKSMRKFYEQRRLKTILKFILFTFSAFFLIVFVFVIFAFISVFQI